MSELNGGGNHLVPISQLVEHGFEVYDCPVDRQRVADAILSNMRVKISYGFSALFVIGLAEWFRLQIAGRQRRIVVCSGYCINVYIDAGWPERSRTISPGELVKMLMFKFDVQGEKSQ